MNRISIFYITILVLFSTSILSAASTGKVEGYVLDSQSGDALPGANVIIEGTGFGTATDANGKFTISQVPVGIYQLSIIYMGYENKVVDIEVIEGETTSMLINLDFQTIEGEVITVTAQAKGQMEAINQQISNIKVTNVVSADRIQEVPDANAAESVGRLPGVSLKRSSGEGNEIVIRGLSPRMNLVTVNGVRMPSTNENNNAVGLAGVSQYMLDGIEVRKSLTAEDDADVVGGIVDLKLATAPEGYHFNTLFEGMYNGLTETYGSYRGSIQGSGRFFDNKLGVISQVSLEQADRPNHNLTASFSPDTRIDTTTIHTTKINNGVARFDDIVRDRFGANLLLDYKLPHGKIQFHSMFNELKEDRWERRYAFVTAAAGSPSLQKQHYSIYDQNYSLVNGLSLETEIFGMAYFDFGAAITRGVREGDEYQLDVGYDLALPTPTRDIDYYGKTAYDVFNAIYAPKGNYMIWVLLSKGRKFIENESAIQANLKFPFSIGTMVSGDVKFGGKMRLKDRDFDYNQNGGNIYGGDSDLIRAMVRDNPEIDWPWASPGDVPASVPKFPASPLYYADSSDKVEILEDRVNLKDFCERKWIDQLAKRADAANWAGLSHMVWQAADLGNDYNGNEEFYAGYFMTDFNLSKKLSINAGIRYEKERTKYQGYGIQDGANINAGLDTLDATTRRNDYILPSATLRYNYSDWGDVRIAYYKSLSRPEYYAFIPHFHVDLSKSLGNNPAGNTYLRPSKANNFDLILSFYNNYIGLFTLGGFYKEIDDYYYLRTFKVTDVIEDNKILPYNEITVPRGQKISLYWNNTEPAYIRGLEFDWQTNFWYLPFPLNGLVLGANYTKISSKTRYYMADDELKRIPTDLDQDGIIRRWEFIEELVDTFLTAPMVDQPEDIFNLSVGYDYKDFSMRFAYYFQGSALNYKTNNNLDGFDDNYSRLDLSIRQKFPIKGLSFQILWSNITEERERAHTYSLYFGNREEYYGSTASIGLRYEF